MVLTRPGEVNAEVACDDTPACGKSLSRVEYEEGAMRWGWVMTLLMSLLAFLWGGLTPSRQGWALG